MLPSAHILPAVALAVRTRPKTSLLWLPALVVLVHLPFDLLPHVEPGLIFQGNYTHPTSAGFWWALSDILGTMWVVYRVHANFPKHGMVVWLCFVFGLLPDLVQAWGQMQFLPQPEWMVQYSYIHDKVHFWWKLEWPHSLSISVGTILTVLLWFFSFRSINKSYMDS